MKNALVEVSGDVLGQRRRSRKSQADQSSSDIQILSIRVDEINFGLALRPRIVNWKEFDFLVGGQDLQPAEAIAIDLDAGDLRTGVRKCCEVISLKINSKLISP